jgi:hypothetical protein
VESETATKDDYRRQAAKMFTLAESTTNTAEKSGFLALAQAWSSLARACSEQKRIGSDEADRHEAAGTKIGPRR